MDGSKPQTLHDVVASVISVTSDSENIDMKYEDGPTPVKLMKIKRYQLHPKTYSPKWEEDPNYKGWVQRSKKGDGYYYCLACNQDYTCGKSELDKHASSRKHCMNLMSLPKMMAENNQPTEQVTIANCETFESEDMFETQDIDAPFTSETSQVSSYESREEAFAKFIISEMKRIKKKKNFELVKWKILQVLQEAMVQEAEDEESED